MTTIIIPGQPSMKPRMTRRDKWMQRPTVLRYRAWALIAWMEAQRCGLRVALTGPTTVHAIAYFEIPRSYSRKRREALGGQPHTLRGDVDNIGKAILDAFWPESDAAVHDLHVVKRWDDGQGPRVVVHVEFD
tara:strand:- start:656 stop:1051 length:396 start_codon:yes stop_codon:yes gene_type:complete